MPQAPGTAATDLSRLVALLRAGDIDAAIEAGLMTLDVEAPEAACHPAARRLILATRQRLRAAWEARERFRARTDRCARRAAGRAARRESPPAPPAGQSARPPLPPAAAAALARAKARAGGT